MSKRGKPLERACAGGVMLGLIARWNYYPNRRTSQLGLHVEPAGHLPRSAQARPSRPTRPSGLHYLYDVTGSMQNDLHREFP